MNQQDRRNGNQGRSRNNDDDLQATTISAISCRNKQNPNHLVDIHRRFLEKMNQNQRRSKSRDSLKRTKLLQLRHRRMTLFAQLEAKRQTQYTTVGDCLRKRKRATDHILSSFFAASHDDEPKHVTASTTAANANSAQVQANQNAGSSHTNNHHTTGAAHHNDIVLEELSRRDLVRQLHTRRLRRKFLAAYRLAGLTMTPMILQAGAVHSSPNELNANLVQDINKSGGSGVGGDDQIDGSNYENDHAGIHHQSQAVLIRLDISHQGRFLACYHAVFELIVSLIANNRMNDDEEEDDHYGDETSPDWDKTMLEIRMRQHTLPAAIPYDAIIKEVVGGDEHAISMTNSSDHSFHYNGLSETGALPEKHVINGSDLQFVLQKCAMRLHSACSCYIARKEAFLFLESLVKDHRTKSTHSSIRQYPTRVVVEQLEGSPNLDEISFKVNIGRSTSLFVHLEYNNLFRSLPGLVSVQYLSPTGKKMRPAATIPAGHVSDDDDSKQDEIDIVNGDISQRCKSALMRLSISEAMDETVHAAQELD